MLQTRNPNQPYTPSTNTIHQNHGIIKPDQIPSIPHRSNKPISSLPSLIMSNTRFPNSSYQPRSEKVIPYSASDPSTFAYTSTIERWPKILTRVIDQIVNLNHRFAIDDDQIIGTLALIEGKHIISQISELKYQSTRDKSLRPLSDDGGSNVLVYNHELAKAGAALQSTWFTSSWLFAECYLYRQLHTFFRTTTHWNTYDPFGLPKANTLRDSYPSMISLTDRFNQHLQRSPQPIRSNKPGFLEFITSSLWGNATDLSLLPTLTTDELIKLQSERNGGTDDQMIIKNDVQIVWDHLTSSMMMNDEEGDQQTGTIRSKRIDLVLDNAGFELFTDLILADWFVSVSGLSITKVVFHPKDIPWFVSDVMEKDIDELLETISNHSTGQDVDGIENLKILGNRWKKYFDDRVWEVWGGDRASVWTKPLPFWDLSNCLQVGSSEVDVEIWEELKSSDLVIFKGDLNYRKLTGDATWDPTTRFEEAIGPLNGQINLLSLRTCKADVVVGLEQGLSQRLDEVDSDWRINGKYGMISFAARTPE